MSFSHDLKQELLQNKPTRVRFKTAQAYGLFLFGRAFGPGDISLHTENQEVVALFQWFAKDFLGRNTPFAMGERQRGGGAVYTISLPVEADRLRLLEHFRHQGGINREHLSTPDHLGAFLAGAYLSGGNITDPGKSYHMEFVARDKLLCDDLTALLDEAIPGARVSERRRKRIVYYKECGPIEDLMTLMGATKSCLAVIDIEMFKSVRNQANRATNCETANIDKLVGAATSQIDDINLIFAEKGAESLPEALRTAAQLRLDNPEASLRELAELSDPAVSRSGMHHRLASLGKMAAEIREQRGESQ